MPSRSRLLTNARGVSMSRVIITGGNRGIGLELAKSYILNGDQVVVGCRQPSKATELASLNPTDILPIDVGDEQSVKAFAKKIDYPVDILINNAGTSVENMGLERSQAGVMDAPIDLTLEMIKINGLSAAMVTRELTDKLNAGAKVANISSQIGSMVVGAGFDNLPYSTSKAVMNMVTVQLASHLKKNNVTVVCFHPGWVRTDMGGSGADLSSSQAAQAINTTIATITPEKSGLFLRWDGSTHPW